MIQILFLEVEVVEKENLKKKCHLPLSLNKGTVFFVRIP